MQVQTTSRRTN